MRRLILPFALAAMAAASLSACGQKGPLYMPPPPAPGTTAKPQAVPHPASSSTAPSTVPMVAPAIPAGNLTPYNSVIHQ